MKIGMMGTGTISQWISNTLMKLGDSNIEQYAVTSKFPEECQKFIDEFGWQKSYETFEELLADPAVDVVYIAVPNAFHYALCRQALESGKNVVCEKPFMMNEKEGRELFDLAAEKGLFLCEAIWMNFLPSRKVIEDALASGMIGEVTGADIRMNMNVMFLDGIKRWETGGGALLDAGPYALGRTALHFGHDVKSAKAEFRFLDTGVDAGEKIELEYADGRKINVEINIDADPENESCDIYGTKGKLVIEGTANPKAVKIYDLNGELVKELDIPAQISGYEYEFIAFEKALREGKLQTDEAPAEHTLFVARIMDTIRRDNGYKFVGE